MAPAHPSVPLSLTPHSLTHSLSLSLSLLTLPQHSGTPYYIAPEVIRQNYALKADVWSCGIVLYVLLTGKTPFHREDDRKHSYKVVFRRILEDTIDYSKDPWPNISEDAKDLCRKLLCKSPAKRISAKEALQHPWIVQAMDSNKEKGESLSVWVSGVTRDELTLLAERCRPQPEKLTSLIISSRHQAMAAPEAPPLFRGCSSSAPTASSSSAFCTGSPRSSPPQRSRK